MQRSSVEKMMRRFVVPTQLVATLACLTPGLAAQAHQHTAGMTHAVPAAGAAASPGATGQAAFAAIADVVARLEADPGTDWSRVDIERLRQHLIDMDHVTLRSRVVARAVAGGFEADVTGEGEVTAAIRRMLTAHAAQVSAEGTVRASVREVPGGVRLTVTTPDPADARAVARLRGLGVHGFLTLGAHHGPHHEAMARGTMGH